MELFNLSLLILGLLLLVTFIFRSQRSNGPKLPPGKTGWPVIGEANEFVSSGRQGTPETFVNKRMHKYSPQVFKTSLAGETMAVFCGPAGNKFLFSNENKLVVSWWPPTIEKINIAKSNRSNSTILTKKMKSIIPEFVKPEALQKYVPIMDCTARKHLEGEWTSPDGQVHAFPLSKKLTFALACRLFMNVEDADTVARLAANFALVTAGLLSVPIDFPGTAFNRAVKAANLIREDLLPIIKMRRNQVREKELNITHDLLSQLLLATDDDGKFLTEMEIVDMILGILIASHDTTSTVITFVVYYLADHPHVYAQVLKEQMGIASSKRPEELLNWEDMQKMKYSRNVINEVLRLQPPSQGAFKRAITDFTYAGFTIPIGWKAFWSVHTTHKDPDYFPDPEKFDPSRFEGKGPAPFTFVPFGGGPRMCPGSEFARLEVLIFMHRFTTKFKWSRLIPNEKIIYEPSPIPANGLPIRLLPRED